MPEQVTQEEFKAFLHCTLQSIKFAPQETYQDTVDALCDAYFEPHRVYHGPQHIMEYVRYLQSVREHFVEGDSLTYEQALFAALFHDFVQDLEYPQRNESFSAAVAEKWAKTLEFDMGAGPAAIFLTTPFLVGDHGAITHNGALFLDGDNMWLSSPEAFEAAEQAIVQEYSNFFPTAAVLLGRANFYERFHAHTHGQPFLSPHNQSRNKMASLLLERAINNRE